MPLLVFNHVDPELAKPRKYLYQIASTPFRYKHNLVTLIFAVAESENRNRTYFFMF